MLKFRFAVKIVYHAQFMIFKYLYINVLLKNNKYIYGSKRL
jgi:hypothetical protein